MRLIIQPLDVHGPACPRTRSPHVAFRTAADAGRHPLPPVRHSGPDPSVLLAGDDSVGLGGPRARRRLEFLIWVAVVFVSILVHELGHAFTQRHFGGHPWITLHALGGLASCDDCDRRPSSQILISLAGPAAGFLLAAVIVMILAATGHFDRFELSLVPVRWKLFDIEYLREQLGALSPLDNACLGPAVGQHSCGAWSICCPFIRWTAAAWLARCARWRGRRGHRGVAADLDPRRRTHGRGRAGSLALVFHGHVVSVIWRSPTSKRCEAYRMSA